MTVQDPGIDGKPTGGGAPTAPRRARTRRGLVAAVAAVLLGLGAGVTGYAVGTGAQDPAPQQQPAAATLAAPDPSTSTTGPAGAPATVRGPTMPAAAPASISIPAIDVASPVNEVGLNPDNTMQVPQPGPRYDQAAWYRYSPTPGELGPSVIIGHVDSAADGPSVFYDLGRLQSGQRVRVQRSDHSTAVFAVDRVESYPKDTFPSATVYGDTDRAALRLITCGGSFNHDIGSYRNNIVVFAHLVGTRAPG